MSRPRFGCVVLTMGRRPEDLRMAVDSVLRQDGVDLDVVVVGQAWEPTGLPDGVRGVRLAENVGIPAGRNAGVPHVTGELLFFLDEDAALVDRDELARVAALLEANPSIGLVQLRVDPREGGPAPRDWHPRLRASGRNRPGEATLVWEGAVAMPRSVYDEVGGWPGDFLFVHEGVDLAWRVMDAGKRVHYAADLPVLHPRPAPGVRHGYSLYYAARNRVWLARRYLPWPLGALFVGSFAARTLPLLRSLEEVRRAVHGYMDGMRGPFGERRRLKAKTLWRMTRAGRPPIL